MRLHRVIFIALAGLAIRGQSQTSITPIWTRLISSPTHATRLALDHQSARLHLGFRAPSDPRTHIRAFEMDGSDTPAPNTELVLGTFEETFGMDDQLLRLKAMSDTLYYVEHLVRNDIDFNEYMHRAGCITIDSNVVFNLLDHSYGSLSDIHHDHLGELIASPTILRSFSSRHWLSGRATVPTTDRIVADEIRIYCGRMPSIAVLDRDQMSMLAPIAVPSGGTSTRTLLMLADEVIHYASVNSNLTLDIGAVDTTGSVIWNILLSLSQPTTLSGITTDALGNFWVACSQSGAFPTGVLYRFSAAGTQTGNYLCGRTIDDIVCSGDQVFLSGWDAVDQTMVYLAAFDTDITTSTPFPGSSGSTVSPNPANEVLYVHGNTTWTEGWVADATGKTVVSIPQAELSSGSISISNLAAGIYRLSVRNGKDAAQLPFMIAR